jgi:23S rRNA (adenine2503-C2)-methyltransferase
MNALSDSLLGLTRERLAALMEERGEPSYRGAQLFRWLHARRVTDFASMTDLPVDLRSDLASSFSIARPAVAGRRESADGAVKWSLRLSDGERTEAVYLPEAHGVTLCLSTQVGCAYGCTFCATAAMGLVRNLTAAEITGQALALADAHRLAPETAFNVVFMGMGEPLDNLDAVLEAFEILTDELGLGLSWRRVTVSTVGHVPGIRRLGACRRRPRLAISLNATDDEMRSRLMPVNRKWPLEQLREAVAAFPTRPGERITFEYVLLSGENDTAGDLERLAGLISSLPARVNLIPFNPHPGLFHTRPSDSQVERFRDDLLRRGIDVSVRLSKGRDVAAACGQLVTQRPSKGGRIAS